MSESQNRPLILQYPPLVSELKTHNPYQQYFDSFSDAQQTEEYNSFVQHYYLGYDDLNSSYYSSYDSGYNTFSMSAETYDHIFSEIDDIKKEFSQFNKELVSFRSIKKTTFEDEKVFFESIFQNLKKELESKNEKEVSDLSKRLQRLESIVERNNKKTENRLTELEKSVLLFQKRDRLAQKITERMNSFESRITMMISQIKQLESIVQKTDEAKDKLEKKYMQLDAKISRELKINLDQINSLNKEIKTYSSFLKKQKERSIGVNTEQEEVKTVILPEKVEQKIAETTEPEKTHIKKNLHEIITHPHILEIVFSKNITQTTLPTFLFYLKKSMISFSTSSIMKDKVLQDESLECLEHLISSEFHSNHFGSLKATFDVFFKLEQSDFQKIGGIVSSNLENCFSFKKNESSSSIFNFCHSFLEHINSDLIFYVNFFKKIDDDKILIFFCRFFDQVISTYSKSNIKNKNMMTSIGASKVLEKIKIKISIVEFRKVENSEKIIFSLGQLLENMNIEHYFSVFEEVLSVPQKMTNLDLITIRILLEYINVLETPDFKKKEIYQKIYENNRISKEKIETLKKIIKTQVH